MNEKLIEKGLNITDQIVQGLKDAAPQMVDITFAAIRFDALYNMVAGLFFLVTTIVLFCIGFKLYATFWKYVSADSEAGFIRSIGAIVFGVAVAPTTIITLNYLLDKYMWAALVDPRIALAMRALDKVLTVTNTK